MLKTLTKRGPEMRKWESKVLMRRKPYLLALIPLVLLATSAGWSQFRARIELVDVPVNVRDADGRLVTGLTKDDFKVLEDGVPQTISSFSIDPAPLSAAIIVDDGMGGNALKRVADALDVMTSGFSAEDEMASFRYDHFVWKLSDFTSDPAAIQKSFGELSKIAQTRPAEGEPGEPLATGPGWLRSVLGNVTIGTNGAPTTVPTAKDRPKPAPTSRILHNAIYDAANVLKSRPEHRRRMILLISDGQVGGSGNTQTLEKNIDLLLQNNIQVYSVATDYALREGPLGVLSVYAKATGGDVYRGGSANEMETAFTKITEQARNQYVLGYSSTNESRSKAGVRREIQVETRTPGQTVTHRKTYLQYPPK
jgi:VWFA-related protein